MTFTRNYFWRTHHKSPYTRTSYSSVRSPYSSSLAKGFNNNGRFGRHPSCGRYNCKHQNNFGAGQNNVGAVQNNVGVELKQIHTGKGDCPKRILNGVVNSKAQRYIRPELNIQGVVRSKSDSGIALQTLTVASAPEEQTQQNVSI